MPLALNDRVQQTGTANTTVSFTLSGSVAGFQSFAVIGNTNTTYYSAFDGAGNWEVGLGTYSTTGPTLTRTTVYSSSNSNTAVTFSGTVNVFVTYPSSRSVYEDDSGNVSPLGTIASGVWQGSTVGVAYGGTGVTTSSGANSVMLRDANQNVAINRLNQSNTATTSAGGTTVLTAASSYSQTLNGSTTQTYRMPDATTLTTGVAFEFNNNSSGLLTIQDSALATITTITSGGAIELVLLSNGTVAGTWDVHGYLPENVTWGTNALALGSTVISGGTWQGGTIGTAYGGTGLSGATPFTVANNAIYSTSASALAAGTLPTAAGGTALTSFTANGALYATSTSALTTGTLPIASGGTNSTATATAGGIGYGTGTAHAYTAAGTSGQVLTSAGAGVPTWTTPTTGTVTSVTGTSPVASSGGATPAISLSAGYGDTLNPYASKTANFVLAAPNGTAGVPTFRAVVAADIPTLNQNTTGTAAGLSATLVATSGGTGQFTYAVGDLLQGGATNTLTKLTAVATGNALISGGVTTASSWGKIGLTTHVSGTLPIGNGGTNLTAYTTGDIVYASATNTLASLADVATGNALISGGVGVAPSYGKIGLTTHVTGTLPIANGGTNGTATPTLGGVIVGTGTAYASTAAGTTGQVLLAQTGAAPVWGSAPGGGVTSIAGTTNQITASASTGAVTLSTPSTFIAPGSIAATTTVTGTTINATQPFIVNSRTATVSYSIPAGSSASSAGPITINSGVVITVPTGAKWVVL